MMKPEYLLLAEGSSVDQDKKVSLFNIFDHLIVERLPAKAPKLTLAFSACIDSDKLPEEIDIKIEFIDPNGEEVFTLNGTGRKQEIDSLDERSKIASVVELDDMIELQVAGTHTYRVMIEGDVLESKELEVIDAGAKR